MAEMIELTVAFIKAKKGNSLQPRITAPNDIESLQWPTLPDMQKYHISPDTLESQWLDHSAPVELGHIDVDCPSEVVDIIRRSMQKETYAPAVQEFDTGVVLFVDDVSDSTQQTTGRLDDDTVLCETANSSDRSPVSESRGGSPSSNAAPARKFKSGPISWLGVKRPKAGSERLRYIIKHKSSRSLEAVTSECSSCLDEFSTNKLILLKCRHGYCAKCFVQLVQTALRTENQFPPKCCLAPIPMKMIFKHIKPEMRDLYKLKAREYAVPVSDRWYCPAAHCGSWIAPTDIKQHSGTQRCPHCRTSICSICRGSAHAIEECPQDTGLTETLAAAELQGWRRCYNCHALVELTGGCRHMTCKCKAQFCYVCGARWCTCTCTDEEHRRRGHNLAQLRAARDASERVTREEEREIEDEIAAVEALERREEAERIQREAERFRAEEERQRREEELAREREIGRLLDIAERTQNLRHVLSRINKMQQEEISKRHKEEAMRICTDTSTLKRGLQADSELLEKQFESNLKKRLDALDASQEAELQQMRTDHVEEEDEIIVTMSRLLKGCKNIEEREVSIMKHLRETHEKEETGLARKHQMDVSDLNHRGFLERKGLRAGLAMRQQTCLKDSDDAFQAFAQSAQIEKTWFERAVAKRFELLEALQEELQRGGQPVAKLVLVPASQVPATA